MTIRPLTIPYGDDTHVRLVLLDLDTSIAHFRRGRFAGDAPAMPWAGEALPENWIERAELNTAQLPADIASITAAVIAISDDLQAHA